MHDDGEDCDDGQQEYWQNRRHLLPARNATTKPWGERRPETPAGGVSAADARPSEPPF